MIPESMGEIGWRPDLAVVDLIRETALCYALETVCATMWETMLDAMLYTFCLSVMLACDARL